LLWKRFDDFLVSLSLAFEHEWEFLGYFILLPLYSQFQLCNLLFQSFNQLFLIVTFDWL
jgi:hypothetical protein